MTNRSEDADEDVSSPFAIENDESSGKDSSDEFIDEEIDEQLKKEYEQAQKTARASGKKQKCETAEKSASRNFGLERSSRRDRKVVNYQEPPLEDIPIEEESFFPTKVRA